MKDTRFAAPAKPAGGIFPFNPCPLVRDAAAFLFSAAQCAGVSLLAASLSSDGPSPPPPRLFDTTLHRGAGIVLHPGLHFVELVGAHDLRRGGPALAAASSAATAAGSFCIIFAGAALCPATQRNPMQLDGLLGAARRARGVLERGESCPIETAELLAAFRDPLMPALRHAVATATRHISSEAASEGNARSCNQLRVRAHGYLIATFMARSVAWDAPGPVPATAFRRGWAEAALLATGAVAPGGRPSSRDPRAIAQASGWEKRTKATSGWPFARDLLPAGHVPRWDVAALHQEYERLFGVLDDDDWLWTVLGQLYRYRPTLDPALVSEVDSLPRAYCAPGTGRDYVPSPFSAEAERVKLPEVFATGVATRITPEEAHAPGNFISPCKFVEKVKSLVPPSVQAAAAACKGAPDSAAVAAVAATAATTARDMVSEVERDVASGLPAAAAADFARARRGAGNPLRLCHNGRHLSSFMDGLSFVHESVTALLRDSSPEDYAWTHDFLSFYYCVEIDPVWRRFFIQEYTSSTGEHIYLRGNVMSMGVFDSGMVAQAGSALVCELAMAYGAPWLFSYIDDLLARARKDQAPAAVAAIARAMELCVPGGEALAKRSEPAPVATLVGHVVDLPNQRVFIPLTRLYHYLVHLYSAHGYLTHGDPRVREAVTSTSLEKLTGKLGWLAEFSPGARPHMTALYAQAYATTPPWGAYRDGIVSNMEYFMRHATAGTLPVASLVQTQPTLRINVSGGGLDRGAPSVSERPAVQQSDAGDPAGAAFFEGEVLLRLFSSAERARGSDWREMVTVLEGVRAFLPRLRGRVLVIVSDHSGNVSCINKGNAKSPAVRDMVRELYELAEQHSFFFVAAWTPRECNAGPDAVSKCETRAEAEAACTQLGVRLLE